ncbi:exostosin-like glycosyltransferase [Haematococcus lacustris]|uniref:Exostosin-like glycosyltransferase n=1 Tax=Haematococcus lacustris TaxID=44745 RepID=A0A699ZII8_HAELA|nr:exostosin-like glycosyltransferase [Haematococcus lacustris]
MAGARPGGRTKPSRGISKQDGKAKPSLATLGPKDLLRALSTEHDALQKIHHSLRINLQKLQVEEQLIKQMIRRERRRLADRDAAVADEEDAGAAGDVFQGQGQDQC